MTRRYLSIEIERNTRLGKIWNSARKKEEIGFFWTYTMWKSNDMSTFFKSSLMLFYFFVPIFASRHGTFELRESKTAYIYAGELTALEKHVAFFDRNKDGIIYRSETYQGFRAISCGIALSLASAAFINGLVGPETQNGTFPSSPFAIHVENIWKAKHGSDSGAYDSEGRFVPEKFEEIFTKHAHTNPIALTAKEVDEMLIANREPKDYKGRLTATSEWNILYMLCKDKDGFLHKDTIRAVYDGSLFVKMEQKSVC